MLTLLGDCRALRLHMPVREPAAAHESGVLKRPALRTARHSLTSILFIIDQLCEDGGAERVLLRIVNTMPRDRFSPHVLTFAIDPALDIVRQISCPVHVFPLRRTYDHTAFAAARRIRTLVRSHHIQITHTFHETSDLWGGIVAKLSGCPILISSRRDMGFQRGVKHNLGYRVFGRYFDEVQTVSETVRAFCIAKDRLSPGRVRTLYNGVALTPQPTMRERAEVRKRLGVPMDGSLVISVGHIRGVKGFDIVLEAARRVHRAMPDVTFAIAGEEHDESLARELRDRAQKYGMEGRFLLLGPVSDMPALLHASDVFCLLSRTEGLSNALLEAMACRLPCIATRVGGNPEVVLDSKTGFLVDSGDAEGAAARILEVLRDRRLAVDMGAAGRRTVEEKFTADTMVQAVIESYDRLLQSRKLL